MEGPLNKRAFLLRTADESLSTFSLLFHDLQLVTGESESVSEEFIVNVSVCMENSIPHVKSPFVGIFSVCFSVRIPIPWQKREGSLCGHRDVEPHVLGSNDHRNERTACNHHDKGSIDAVAAIGRERKSDPQVKNASPKTSQCKAEANRRETQKTHRP